MIALAKAKRAIAVLVGVAAMSAWSTAAAADDVDNDEGLRSVPAPFVSPRVPPAPARLDARERVDGVVLKRVPDEATTVVDVSSSRACIDSLGPGEAKADRPSEGSLVVGRNDGVQFVREETFRHDTHGNAHLDLRELWIDPKSSGVRTIARATVALSPVGGLPDLLVYGYREGDRFHVVVPLAAPPPSSSDEGEDAPSSCGHVHAVLNPKDDANGGTIVLRVEQPDVVRDEDVARADDDDASRRDGEGDVGLSSAKATSVRYLIVASASRASADVDPVITVTVRKAVAARGSGHALVPSASARVAMAAILADASRGPAAFEASKE